jgi:guanosine-3',5'-bis(diphosphate) 3'-pyrophosphohydrolase
MDHDESHHFFLPSSKKMGRSIQSCREMVKKYACNDAAVLEMFDKTVSAWCTYYDQSMGELNLQLLLKAVSFAAMKHQGQTRDNVDGTPYIIHPMGVAYLLWDIGEIRDENVLVAALLHDTLEDTSTTPKDIESRFGTTILNIVQEVTDDPTLNSQENKQKQIDHAPYLSLDAKRVKLADRLYNVRDLRMMPPQWSAAQIKTYLGWGQKMLDALRGTNSALEEALQQEIVLQSQS